eukprot:Rmarinus@m.4793
MSNPLLRSVQRNSPRNFASFDPVETRTAGVQTGVSVTGTNDFLVDKEAQTPFFDPAAVAFARAVEKGLQSDVTDSELEREALPTVYRAGWLMKQGGKWKSWKRRWVVLNDHWMVYYTDDKSDTPVGVPVNLRGCDVMLPDNPALKEDLCFIVRTTCVTNKRPNYVLKASSLEEREDWMSDFKIAGTVRSPKERGVVDAESESEGPSSRFSSVSSAVGGPRGRPPHQRLGRQIRHLVSKKKRRFVGGGYDLDLTYITEHIIAMGFPSEGTEGVYRNPLEEVRRFLDERHKDKYKVYNLCSERTYNAKKFHNRVALYPFDDHNAPPLEMIADFCVDAARYLSKPGRVAAIHCKAGKGRTGCMICCLLMHLGICHTAQESLELYGSVRTRNNKGVTISSQARYVSYYEHVLLNGLPHPVARVLQTLTVFTIPKFDNSGGCAPILICWSNGREVYNSKRKLGKILHYDPDEHTQFSWEIDVPVHGDVKIACYHQDKSELMFYLCFHIAYTSELLSLGKPVIDKANKDKKGRFSPDFRLELSFGPEQKLPEDA